MARFKNNPLAALQGACGPIEIYQCRGQVIVRSRRRKSTKAYSMKQRAERQKMALVNQFLSCFTPFIKIGFAASVIGKTYAAYNAAVSYQLRNTVTGIYPDFSINYVKVRLSEGPIPIMDIQATVALVNEQLYFTWIPEQSYPHCNDHVMLLAYAPGLQEAVFNLCGAKRSTGLEVLPLPDLSWKGQIMETYLAFMEEGSSVCSNSLYLGQIG
jgi:hypothetical protein